MPSTFEVILQLMHYINYVRTYLLTYLPVVCVRCVIVAVVWDACAVVIALDVAVLVTSAPVIETL